MKLFLITPDDSYAEHQGAPRETFDTLVTAATAAQAVHIAAKELYCNNATFAQVEESLGPGEAWTVRELPLPGNEAGAVELSECAFTFWEAHRR